MQVVCGIILSFPRLYPTGGQITHALLSRLPLYHCGRSHDHARLACIKRAASVHPEPGSNSLNENLTSFHYSAVKVPTPAGGPIPSTAIAFGYCTPSSLYCQHRTSAEFAGPALLPGRPPDGIILTAPLATVADGLNSWGRVGSTGAVSDGLQAEVAAALAKNSGEQVTGEREFALAA